METGDRTMSGKKQDNIIMETGQCEDGDRTTFGWRQGNIGMVTG